MFRVGPLVLLVATAGCASSHPSDAPDAGAVRDRDSGASDPDAGHAAGRDAAVARDASVVQGDAGVPRVVEVVEIDPPAGEQVGDDDDDGFVATALGGDDCDDGDPTVHPGAADGGWVFEVVDDVDSWGPNVGAISLAIDGRESPWIFYSEHLPIWDTGVRTPMRVARRLSGAWRRFELLTPQREPETYCCGAGDVSFTAAGDPMLTYSSSTDFAEGFAHVLYRQGSEWLDECPLCDQEGLAFVHASAAIASDGAWRLVVGFEDSWGQLGWLWSGRRVGDGWEVLQVDDHGGGPRLALDSNDEAHIVCARPRALVKYGEDLRYTEEADDQWSTELMPVDDYDWDYDLVMDGATPVVMFRARDGLTCARREAGDWVLEVAHTGSGGVMDIDVAADEEGLQVLFRRYNNLAGDPDFGHDLRLARRRAGVWEEEIVTDRDFAVPRLALGPSGATYIAFWAMPAGTVDALELATRTPDADGIDQDCDGHDG